MCYLFCELLAQARDLCQTVHIAFSNTELEYPEIRIFAKWFATQWLPKRFPSLDIRFYSICPKIGFRESILKSGYPIVSKEVASSIMKRDGTQTEQEQSGCGENIADAMGQNRNSIWKNGPS